MDYSDILDLIIGLAFIYVLYSLLATTLHELVASIFAYRHRMLERALEQMLDGKNYDYSWWDKALNGVLFLIYLLRLCYEKISGRPNPPPEIFRWPNLKKFFQKDGFTSSQTVQIQGTESQQAGVRIIRRKLNKKAGLFAAKITAHPLYRRKSENSWLIKKPAYLEASAFSDILGDVLSKPAGVAATSPILMANIQSYVNTGLGNNEGLKNILQLFIEQANGDVQRFKLLVEDWFNDTMKRVTGWYKRQSNFSLLLIGFLLALAFNVDTIKIVKNLSVNKSARRALAANANAYLKGNNPPGDANTKDSRYYLGRIDSLYHNEVTAGNKILGLGWDSPSDIRKRAHDPMFYAGLLLTAIAVSLGAPFWFDLLNKFINLRAAGKRPADTSSSESELSKTILLNQKPDPAAKG